ncbi:MAG: hypothetical protein NTX05_03010 [Fusobacteria bacterium]|nr:hypothetical protein [Fusobacteriota bacterium]
MFVIQEMKKDVRKHSLILGVLMVVFCVILYFKKDAVLVSGTLLSDTEIQNKIAQALLVLFILLCVALSFALIGAMRYYSRNIRIDYESTNGGYLIVVLVMLLVMYIASHSSFINYTSSIMLLTFIVSLILKIWLIKWRNEKLIFEVISFISLCVVVLIILFSNTFSWLNFVVFSHESVVRGYSLSVIVTVVFILISYRRFNFLLLKKDIQTGDLSPLGVRVFSGGQFVTLILEIVTLYYFGVFLFLDVISLSACDKYREYFFPFIIFSCVVGFEVLLFAYEISKLSSISLLSISLVVMLLGAIYIVFTGFFNYFSPFRRNR